MTTVEIFSTTISFLALVISAFTAYRTLFASFRGELFLKPRAILTRFDQTPSLVVGCEISNLGAKSSAIDDIVLIIKYRQKDTKSINTYSFLPLLSREFYSVFETYEQTDFEPFQSIPVPAKSRLTRYIVFSPSNDSFSPSAGEIELQLFSRTSEETKWQKTDRDLNFPVDDNSANIWKDPNGESIMIEAIENDSLREKLMEMIFR